MISRGHSIADEKNFSRRSERELLACQLLLIPKLPPIDFMPRILLLLLVALLSPLSAQEGEFGFLNIANMIPSEKSCNINIGGKELVPGGLKAVSSTGWFIVPKGEHSMTLEVEGYKTASGTIKIETNVSVLYVAFLQQIGAKKDDEGKEIPPQLRIRRCEALAEQKGHYLRAMSFCPEPESFQVGPHKMVLELFGSQEVSNWNGGAFQVLHGSTTIGSCAGAQEKGSYFLLIGSDHKQTTASLLVRGETQELPPWMKQKKP